MIGKQMKYYSFFNNWHSFDNHQLLFCVWEILCVIQPFFLHFIFSVRRFSWLLLFRLRWLSLSLFSKENHSSSHKFVFLKIQLSLSLNTHQEWNQTHFLLYFYLLILQVFQIQLILLRLWPFCLHYHLVYCFFPRCSLFLQSTHLVLILHSSLSKQYSLIIS